MERMKRKVQKHLPYFAVLEALRESPECPLCALESACVSRYFRNLLYERVNDPGGRTDLARSRGFCRPHAHRLLEYAGALGISILYGDQVRAFLEFLERLAKGGRAPRLGEFPTWQSHDGCPACRLQTNTRDRHISVLLEGLAEPEMHRSFQESAGLCVPHFLRVVERAKDVETRHFIIQVVREKFVKLLADLSEFQRKQDWQFAHEPVGPEGDSWVRAVRMIVGVDQSSQDI